VNEILSSISDHIELASSKHAEVVGHHSNQQ